MNFKNNFTKTANNGLNWIKKNYHQSLFILVKHAKFVKILISILYKPKIFGQSFTPIV